MRYEDFEIGDVFEYDGLNYTVVEADHTMPQCEQCDLCIGHRKLCFANNCDNGHCGYAYNERHDRKKVVFKIMDKELDVEQQQKLQDKKLRTELRLMRHDIEALKEQNKRLREHNITLASANRTLMEKNSKYENQLKTIYANINKAIKTEIYKYMTKN